MERLQKLLAHAGIASRRHAEKLIVEGRVSVNGTTVTELGTKADPAVDVIEVDGKRVRFSSQRHYLLLNKPPGLLCTRHDPQGRPTVMDLLPTRLHSHVYPVGRLDMNTEGLLLLTDDGELAHALMHPSYEIPRTYHATVRGHVTAQTLRRLEAGVELEDGLSRADEAQILEYMPEATVVQVTLHRGRKHEVRRMCEAVGHPVLALRRISMGPLTLGTLAPGKWRELSHRQVEALYRAVGLRRGGVDGR